MSSFLFKNPIEYVAVVTNSQRTVHITAVGHTHNYLYYSLFIFVIVCELFKLIKSQRLIGYRRVICVASSCARILTRPPQLCL
jgi:hypothetical protein